MDIPVSIEQTEDGSYTLYNPLVNEHYHSRFGAFTESQHVFIQSGLNTQLFKEKVSVLEIGFGTGLNALLTFQELKTSGKSCHYTGIDTFPITKSIFDPTLFNVSDNNSLDFYVWSEIIAAPWDQSIAINQNFQIYKVQGNLLNFLFSEKYDCIYFDAFAPDKQPELWTVEVFSNLYSLVHEGGVLTTYSSKGQVRRNMIEAGFKVEKIPGPPHKREMLRAWKV